MTDDLIARAKAALEGVTVGPWTADSESYGAWGHMILQQDNQLTDIAEMVVYRADANFIAAARQLVPDLIAALEARDARIAELERDVAAALRREDDANIAAFGHLRCAVAAEARVKVLEDALTDIISIGGCYGGAAHMQKVDDIARAALEGEK